MISKSLSTSRKFAALHAEAGDLAEFCQTLFPLLVAHADDFGRLQGDVFTIKHLILPTSPRSLEHFDTALFALDRVGLIQRYRTPDNGGPGCDYIQVLCFETHQTGLHNRTKSRFPEPPEVSGKFREFPGDSRLTELNLTELNLTERKGTEQSAPASVTPIRTPDRSQTRTAATPAPSTATADGGIRTAALTAGLREHRNHACCGVVCLHSSQFDDFLRRSRHRPDPDRYVREFFRAWDDRYATGDRKDAEIGADGFDFWRDRWKEIHPVEAVVPTERAEAILARRKARTS